MINYGLNKDQLKLCIRFVHLVVMIVVIQPPDHHTSSRKSDYANSIVDWQSWVSQEIHGKYLGERCEFVKKNIPVKIRKKGAVSDGTYT